MRPSSSEIAVWSEEAEHVVKLKCANPSRNTPSNPKILEKEDAVLTQSWGLVGW